MQLQSPKISLSRIINTVLEKSSFPWDKTNFERMYRNWDIWETEIMRFYQDNLEIVRRVLDGSIDASSLDEAAFNTFVRLNGLDKGTNNIDFLAKLMFTLATYTQIGPCFGISQKTWDNQLGIWPRITYACSRTDLIEGLIRLITAARFYSEKNFGDPNRFPVLNICYEDQI